MSWLSGKKHAILCAAAISVAVFALSSLHVALGAPTQVISAELHIQQTPSAFGQQPEPDSTPAATSLPPTPLAPIGILSPTVLVSQTSALTATTAPTDTSDVTATAGILGATPTTEAALDPSADQQPTPAAAKAPDVSATGQPLRGTIVSNRSTYAARFFLEGQVYRVEPSSSTGTELARATSVLSLFTCDASTPETQDGCFWDPYLLQRDGFYEIVDQSSVAGLPTLTLRDANIPPEDQVWIHNRTGYTESVVFRDAVIQVASASVLEINVEPGAPVILYVKSCAKLEANEVCEWAPQSLDPGAYYAMLEVSVPGGLPGSRIVTRDLRPVVNGSGQAISAPSEVVCQLRVPAINVRNGPGLQYQIVDKVREAPDAPGQIAVAGRSADGQWFAVAESVAPNGWITSNPDFVGCSGNPDDLPLAEYVAPQRTPTTQPPPAVAEEAPQQPAASQAEPAQPEQTVNASDVITAIVESPAAESPTDEAPEGLALLLVNNGFQFPIRFTVDQRYRPVEGPSETDLESGESTRVLVFPGDIAFTASSPWNALSGNAEVFAGADQSVTLWLRFEQDPVGSSNWELAWD